MIVTFYVESEDLMYACSFEKGTPLQRMEEELIERYGTIEIMTIDFL